MFIFLRKCLFHFIISLIFLVVVSGVILSAYGYKMDFGDYSLVKTSIIHLAGEKNDQVEVYLDGELLAYSIPSKLFNVPLGYREIKVIKKGFQPWQRTVKLEADLVVKIDGIKLVPNNLKELAVIHGDKVWLWPDYEAILVWDEKLHNLRLFKGVEKISPDRIWELPATKVKQVNWLSKQRFWLELEANNGQMYDIDQPQPIQSWIWPNSYKDLVLVNAWPSLSGYALENGNLLSFPLDNIKNTNLVWSDFNYYQIKQGLLYAVQNLELWQMDLGNKEKIKLGQIEPSDFTVQYYKDNLVTILFKNGQLFFVDLKENKLWPIDDKVRTVSAISKDGELLYIRGYEIWSFSLVSKQSRFITRYAEELKQIAFSEDGYNFFFSKGQILVMCDELGSNCHDLAEIDPNQPFKYFAETSQLVFAKNNSVYLLDLN